VRQPREHEIQAAIVDALRLAGLTVYETTAYRQRGASGVDRGIPDLLICHPSAMYTYLGIEVKRPGPIRWSSPEQGRAYAEHRFALAQSPEQALRVVHAWLFAIGPNDSLALDRIARTLNALRGAA
jgi:hypothetical protein